MEKGKIMATIAKLKTILELSNKIDNELNNLISARAKAETRYVYNTPISQKEQEMVSLFRSFNTISEELGEGSTVNDFPSLNIEANGLIEKLYTKIPDNSIKLKNKEEELKTKEEHLNSLIKSVEKINKILIHTKEGIPELIRSKLQEEIKKSHREIEKNTNPNTKSQNN